MKEYDVRFKGHIGTWYIISSARVNGRTYYLYQSEQYGEDTAGIIADDNGHIIRDDCWNGIDVDLGDYFDIPYEEVEVIV